VDRDLAPIERGIQVPFTCPCGRDYLVVIAVGEERSPNLCPERVSYAVALPGRPAYLSPFERRVLPLVAQGLTDREISQELGASIHSVKRAVRDCLVRLSARNRTEAAMRAATSGLLATGDPRHESRE
jgi:DNA-binding NarL/FixJ family response regulator